MTENTLELLEEIHRDLTALKSRLQAEPELAQMVDQYLKDDPRLFLLLCIKRAGDEKRAAFDRWLDKQDEDFS